jgi:hypothetical protein
MPRTKIPWLPLRACSLLAAAACTASPTGESTGTLEVVTVTTGSNPDLDGYRVAIDGELPRPIAAQGSLTFPAVAAGERRVTLSAVAANCTVADSSARRTVLEAGQTDTVVFAVLCDSMSGRLQIRTTTTGEDLDPSGYVVMVDDLTVATVSDTGVTEVEVAAREHQVALGEVTPNCVPDDNPRAVQVDAGATVPLAFAIRCAPAPLAGRGHEIAFTSEFQEVVLANDDGTGARALFDARGPAAWSRDGSSLAIADGAKIRVGSVDANGGFSSSGDIDLQFGFSEGLAWSPDGTRLALVDQDPEGDCDELSTLQRDGEGQEFLSFCDGYEGNPSWSPDGSTIAIATFGFGDFVILLYDPSGASEPRALDTGSLGPITVAWSPDGSRFAFAARAPGELDRDVFVIDADGQNPRRLTRAPGDDAEPSWSPDGSRIAFVSRRDGNAEIYVMDADGSNPTRITNSPAAETSPAWRP